MQNKVSTFILKQVRKSRAHTLCFQFQQFFGSNLCLQGFPETEASFPFSLLMIALHP
jgi:hypothetical protein